MVVCTVGDRLPLVRPRQPIEEVRGSDRAHRFTTASLNKSWSSNGSLNAVQLIAPGRVRLRATADHALAATRTIIAADPDRYDCVQRVGALALTRQSGGAGACRWMFGESAGLLISQAS